MRKIFNGCKQKFQRKYNAFLGFIGIAMMNVMVPAHAQTNPFDTGELIPAAAGNSWFEKMVWAIKIVLKIGLAFTLLACVIGGIWIAIQGLKHGNAKGEWGEFFMGLTMVIVAIVLAVTLGNMAWTWIDEISAT